MANLGVRSGLSLAIILLAGPLVAQGKAPVSIQDDVSYKGQLYGTYFSQYEREDVRPAPGSGALQKEWIEESYVEIGANADPQLGPADKALALKLSKAFCAHYGLTVRKAPKSAVERDGLWVFYDLCWKEGW